jgi:hypothetical protein
MAYDIPEDGHIRQRHVLMSYLALFADDTCLYATERKEAYVLRKLQRSLNAIETWCEHWNINSMKRRLRQFTSLIGVDRLILTLNWTGTNE